MKEVIWKNPSELPVVKRGGDIKIWAVVDIYQYESKYGGLGIDGKAERIATLKEVNRRVVELNYLNAEATHEELLSFEENGDFPPGTPGGLDNWTNEDGEFIGFTGYYSQYPEEGRMYFEEFKLGADGKYQTTSNWTDKLPERVLLAWGEFEKPTVPESIPE
ncbi:MAG: hypothetical protein ACEQSN_06195 [Yersinia sp. (in: enterobacteria)]